jgi:hypothetical protein
MCLHRSPLIANDRLELAVQSTSYFDKKSHIWQAHHWYIQPVKKIVAHIQRTVTISTVQTTVDVSMSEATVGKPAIPPQDSKTLIPTLKGEKDEKIKDVLIPGNPTRRKPARRVRTGRRPKRKPDPGDGRSGRRNNSQSSGANSNPSGPGACSLLTKDEVSQVLGKPVDSAAGSGLGGVCTYVAKNLKIDFTVAGHTGGIKAMATDFARLGNLALVVPGLGDQAFYNTNSAYALFVLKGDAEYMFGMGDLTYQPLDPAFVQATEKALAEQLLSHLP